jgi:hypothetical protein
VQRELPGHWIGSAAYVTLVQDSIFCELSG